MENVIFEMELNQIKEKMILELSNFWGRGMYPGYKGTIVTKDKEIYKYQCYFRNVPDSQTEDPIYIKKVKELSNEDFEKITEFIQQEIIDKEYEYIMRYDETYTLSVNYNGTTKEIKNNVSNEYAVGIYTVTDKFLSDIINN